jgi:hypothetical protein
MRTGLILALILASSNAAPAAFAEDAAKPATAPAVDARDKKDPNRKVCKKAHSVGSLFPTRLCKTAREWKIEEELAQDTMRRTGKEASPSGL